jgi:putative membrane protein insertion efficiency factor
MSYMLILLIRLYQKMISPFLAPRCRFDPTCSHYAIHAIEFHGLARGTWMALKRISKCHPWGQWGFDPVQRPEHEPLRSQK